MQVKHRCIKQYKNYQVGDIVAIDFIENACYILDNCGAHIEEINSYTLFEHFEAFDETKETNLRTKSKNMSDKFPTTACTNKDFPEIATPTSELIMRVCSSIRDVLLEKNRRYGNSALEPVRIFSKAEPESGILIRLDDKLSRIKNSDELRKNDVFDLLGYLTLLCVQKKWTFDDLID